jgi:hypothetical protein
MGNFLDAVVRNVENRFAKKVLTLDVPDVDLDLFERNVHIKLPKPIDIRKGDTITFYQGVVRLSDWREGAQISHNDYINATVFRGGKPVYEFESGWMKMGIPI